MPKAQNKISLVLILSLAAELSAPIVRAEEAPAPVAVPGKPFTARVSETAAKVRADVADYVDRVTAPDPEDERLKDQSKRPLGDYFSAAELNPPAVSTDRVRMEGPGSEKLKRDVLGLIRQGGRRGVWDAVAFAEWWEKNQDSMITPLQMQSWKDLPVEVFLGLAVARFARDQADGNVSKAKNILQNVVQNEWAIYVLNGTVATVATAASFLGNTVYTAFTVAVIGDIIKSYLDPATKTIREAGGVVGAQQTAWFAVPLNAMGQGFIDRRQAKALQKKKEKEARLRERAAQEGRPVPPTAEEMEKLKNAASSLQEQLPELAEKVEGLSNAEANVTKLSSHANELLDAISFPELTVGQNEENLKLFNQQWSEMVATWNSNLLPTSMQGRNLMIDAVVFRPKDFVRDSAVFETKMEAYRSRIDTVRDKALARANEEARALEQRSNESLHLIAASEESPASRKASMEALLAEKERALAGITAERAAAEEGIASLLAKVTDLAELQYDLKPADWTEVEKMKARLLEGGVFTAAELDDLIDSQRSQVLGRRQMIASIASQMIHDMMFPEFNRKMPESINDMFRVMQKQFGFSYLEKKFRPEIQKILHETKLAIGKQATEARTELVKTTLQSIKATRDLNQAVALEKAAAESTGPTARQVVKNMLLVRGAKAIGKTCAEKFGLVRSTEKAAGKSPDET